MDLRKGDMLFLVAKSMMIKPYMGITIDSFLIPPFLNEGPCKMDESKENG